MVLKKDSTHRDKNYGQKHLSGGRLGVQQRMEKTIRLKD